MYLTRRICAHRIRRGSGKNTNLTLTDKYENDIGHSDRQSQLTESDRIRLKQIRAEQQKQAEKEIWGDKIENSRLTSNNLAKYADEKFKQNKSGLKKHVEAPRMILGMAKDGVLNLDSKHRTGPLSFRQKELLDEAIKAKSFAMKEDASTKHGPAYDQIRWALLCLRTVAGGTLLLLLALSQWHDEFRKLVFEEAGADDYDLVRQLYKMKTLSQDIDFWRRAGDYGMLHETQKKMIQSDLDLSASATVMKVPIYLPAILAKTTLNRVLDHSSNFKVLEAVAPRGAVDSAPVFHTSFEYYRFPFSEFTVPIGQLGIERDQFKPTHVVYDRDGGATVDTTGFKNVFLSSSGGEALFGRDRSTKYVKGMVRADVNVEQLLSIRQHFLEHMLSLTTVPGGESVSQARLDEVKWHIGAFDFWVESFLKSTSAWHALKIAIVDCFAFQTRDKVVLAGFWIGIISLLALRNNYARVKFHLTNSVHAAGFNPLKKKKSALFNRFDRRFLTVGLDRFGAWKNPETDSVILARDVVRYMYALPTEMQGMKSKQQVLEEIHRKYSFTPGQSNRAKDKRTFATDDVEKGADNEAVETSNVSSQRRRRGTEA